MEARRRGDETQPLDVLAIDLDVALLRARERHPSEFVTRLLAACRRELEGVLRDPQASPLRVRVARARAKSALGLWRALDEF